MTATVKEVMQALDELRMKEHVWLFVKDYIEGYLPEGPHRGQPLIVQGVVISESIVIDVLADIDQQCLVPIREQILLVEGASVDEPQKKKRQESGIDTQPAAQATRGRKRKPQAKKGDASN